MDDETRGPVDRPVVDTAVASDVPTIKRMIDGAFSKYTERLGTLPAAMIADYGALIETGSVHVLRVGGRVVASVLLPKGDDSIEIHNLVVDPTAQGRGYGRVLMEFADDMARKQGLPAITLYTNEKMHENIALYQKLGFIETGRKTQDGFNRVFFRKTLE